VPAALRPTVLDRSSKLEVGCWNTGMVKEQFGRSRMPWPVYVAAALRAKLASPTIENSNRIDHWLSEMNRLRLGLANEVASGTQGGFGEARGGRTTIWRAS
jgi:hypothetical protein